MPLPDHYEIKTRELGYLARAAAEEPTLFEQRSFSENNAFLQSFGITLPGKDALPPGFLKLWASDFIVEEEQKDGTLATIAWENVLHPTTPLEFGNTYYATLVKCGLSTFEAIEDMARQLDCQISQIGFAGIKDKNAITAQRVSFRKVSLQKLKTITSPYYFLKNVVVGKGIVEKASLTGNRFTILIRTPVEFFEQTQLDQLTQALTTLQDRGFYNFFYLQRFGTPRLIGAKLGLSLLHGQYKRAVVDLLTFPAPRELEFIRRLRKDIKKNFGNWDMILTLLEPFPILFRHERAVVEYLRRFPSDYQGALMTVPDQLTLWLYALASQYFNETISTLLALGKPIPRTLPLLLSPDPRDWQPYVSLLKRDHIFPPPFENIRIFPMVRLAHRELPTVDYAELHAVELVEQGIILQFSLAKGQYATTFLSHVFNLVAGKLPDGFPNEPGNIQEAIGISSAAETIAYFSRIIQTATDELDESNSSLGS